MNLIKEEIPTNFVPAVAVIQKEWALFGIIWCKEFVDSNLF